MRFLEIDRAKGLLILLVVYGHIAELPPEAPWYVVSKTWIYSYHMPGFMFLSGLLFFLSERAKVTDLTSYLGFIRRRAVRLLPGYFVVGFGIVFAKTLAAGLLHVDNPPGELGAALAMIVLDPLASASRGVWFLQCLLLMNALIIPFLALLGNRIGLALFATVVLYFVPVPQFFGLSQVATFAVFFLLGAVIARDYDRFLTLARANMAAMLLGFAVLSVAVYTFLPPHLHKLIIGVAAIPVCFSLVAGSRPAVGRRWTEFLGRWSYTIYLFNTLSIGLAKGLLLKVLPWTPATLPLFAVLLTAFGVLCPWLLGAYVLRRFEATRVLI